MDIKFVRRSQGELSTPVNLNCLHLSEVKALQSAINERVALLEVALPLTDEEQDLLVNNYKVLTIKRIRERTGLDLASAKALLE